jgi:hypothetical protein
MRKAHPLWRQRDSAHHKTSQNEVLLKHIDRRL